MIRIIALVLLSVAAFGQKKVASVRIDNNVAFAAVDRPGDLYVISIDGTITKFNKSGSVVGSRKFQSVPTIFDPKDGTRAFAYFRNTQTIESITPDLSSTDSSPVHPEFAVSAWLVCPSKNEFWILDSADFTLKKTKGKGSSIAYESAFKENTVTNISYMREYLNFLFVVDDGIHILNNLGKEINRLDVKVADFSFLGEELYYVSGNSINLIDLYTSEKRSIALPHATQFAFLTDDRMILVNEKTIEFFEFAP